MFEFTGCRAEMVYLERIICVINVCDVQFSILCFSVKSRFSFGGWDGLRVRTCFRGGGVDGEWMGGNHIRF